MAPFRIIVGGFEVAALSHQGYVRDHNEDSYSVVHCGPYLIVVVADGMGGHERGEVASGIIKQTVEEFRDSLRESGTGGWKYDPQFFKDLEATTGFQTTMLLGKYEAPARWLVKLLQEANRRVFEWNTVNPSKRNAGSTAVAVIINTDTTEFHFAHVGDSRLYLFNAATQALTLLTRDHTLAQQMADNGLIPQENVANCEEHSTLTRAIGIEAKVKVEVGNQGLAQPLASMSTLLLCTDGLTTMEPSSQVISALMDETPNLSDMTSKLVQRALDNGGQDNITVLAISRAPAKPSLPPQESQHAKPPEPGFVVRTHQQKPQIPEPRTPVDVRFTEQVESSEEWQDQSVESISASTRPQPHRKDSMTQPQAAMLSKKNQLNSTLTRLYPENESSRKGLYILILGLAILGVAIGAGIIRKVSVPPAPPPGYEIVLVKDTLQIRVQNGATVSEHPIEVEAYLALIKDHEQKQFHGLDSVEAAQRIIAELTFEAALHSTLTNVDYEYAQFTQAPSWGFIKYQQEQWGQVKSCLQKLVAFREKYGNDPALHYRQQDAIAALVRMAVQFTTTADQSLDTEAENLIPWILTEVLRAGETVKFPLVNVRFRTQSTSLSEDSVSELLRIVQYLKSSPELELILEVHSDLEGDAARNDTISTRRASSVKTFLTSKAPEAAPRITVIGRGEQEPLITQDELAGSAELKTIEQEVNRRVEVILTRRVAPTSVEAAAAQGTP